MDKFINIRNHKILTRKEINKNLYIAITFGEDNNFWLKSVKENELDVDDTIFIDEDTNTFYKFDDPVIII